MWDNIELITEIIEKSNNKTQVLEYLGYPNNGGNYNTLTSFIRSNDIDISHFTPKRSYKNSNNYVSYPNIEDVLIENSPYKSTNHLKNRLYKESLKTPVCELCGQNEEWRGNKMSLILDHINGINNDNRIGNLRIVCPNCNATLSTHCKGGRIKSTYTRYDKCVCGSKKVKSSNKCFECYHKGRVCENSQTGKTLLVAMKERRKTTRPPYNQLIKEIEESNYTQVGKKYGVSDNAIRKWVSMYEKYGSEF
jgi:hypothetical protein